MFAPDERPEVVVETDDGWADAELAMWERRGDGWWGHVRWNTDAGRAFGTVGGVFPASAIVPLAYCPWYRGHKGCSGVCTAPQGAVDE